MSNAEDGDIATYRMNPTSGELQPGERAKAANMVMPMVVSPDRRFLHAGVRSKPFTVITYAIDRGTGELAQMSTAPLFESFPYLSLDKTGRYLLGASYGAHLVSVNAVDGDGGVSADPLQVIPMGRNAHSIRTDESNRFAYAPSLGSDQIFQYTFDAQTGRLASNTPAVVLLKPLTGPRHLITSSDNRFAYVLNELLATVTTFAIDGTSGLLTELGSASGLPPDTKAWAAEIRLTPDGKLLYFTERTSSSIAGFRVDPASGALTYLGNTPTEKQPRGFAIDPAGKYLVAAGEKSATLSVHAIDAASGALRLAGQYPAGKGANWVEIVSFD